MSRYIDADKLRKCGIKENEDERKATWRMAADI